MSSFSCVGLALRDQYRMRTQELTALYSPRVPNRLNTNRGLSSSSPRYVVETHLPLSKRLCVQQLDQPLRFGSELGGYLRMEVATKG
jgi:hypothetical protein